jgi:hypothetical protein
MAFFLLILTITSEKSFLRPLKEGAVIFLKVVGLGGPV